MASREPTHPCRMNLMGTGLRSLRKMQDNMILLHRCTPRRVPIRRRSMNPMGRGFPCRPRSLAHSSVQLLGLRTRPQAPIHQSRMSPMRKAHTKRRKALRSAHYQGRSRTDSQWNKTVTKYTNDRSKSWQCPSQQENCWTCCCSKNRKSERSFSEFHRLTGTSMPREI